MPLVRRVAEDVRVELSARGHRVVVAGPWANGQVTAVEMRTDGGVDGGGGGPYLRGLIMHALDTLKRRFYKARPLGAALLALWVPAAGAEVVSGAQLPDGSQKVGENRYRAPRDFEARL